MISGVFGPGAPPHQVRHVSQRDESAPLAGFIPVAGNDFDVTDGDAIAVSRSSCANLVPAGASWHAAPAIV
jgi:hypothetical protein